MPRFPLTLQGLGIAVVLAVCATGNSPTNDPGTGGQPPTSYENDQTNANKTLDVPITMSVIENGTLSDVVIGTISVRASETPDMDGDFQFDTHYADLDSSPRDFQWINVLQELTVDGVAQTSSTVSGLLPSIDPPPGDTEPYYYSHSEWSSGHFGPDQIHKEGVRSRFLDQRYLAPPSNHTSFYHFRTYLVAEEGSTTFCVLGGFEWIYSVTPTQGSASIGIVGSLPSEITWINTALQNGVNSSPGDPAYPGYPGYAAQLYSACQPQLSMTIQPHPNPWTAMCGPAPFALAGYSVAGGVDLDGDSIKDFICGAPTSNGASGNVIQTGSVSLRSGSTGASLLTVFGQSANDHLGAAVAFVGDLDGDGVSDYAVGAPQSVVYEPIYNVGPGYVQVRSGGTANLLYTAFGDAVGDGFGASIAAVGDIDGDGVGDIAVGAPRALLGTASVGMMRMISGANGSTIFSCYGLAVDDMFGSAVVGISDVNGDGYNDVVVGAPRFDQLTGPGVGYVRVISGLNGSPLSTIFGTSSDEAFGMALAKPSLPGGVLSAAAGIHVGAPCHNSFTGMRVGALYRFDALTGTLLSVVEGQSPGDFLGTSLAWLTDYNGDGTPDLLVGAVQSDLGFAVNGPGYVKVFPNGGTQSIDELRGDKGGDAFGAAVASAGDLNGDGASEFIVGVPLADTCGYNAGRALVFAGIVSHTGVAYCFGDGSGTACPCGNSGYPGNGCANSLNPAGSNLAATGTASVSADTIVLHGTGMPNSSALYFEGSSQTATVFGDGLRCAGGTIVRLGTKANNGSGASQYPAAGDPSVSVRGLVPAAGGMFDYQVWYRNAAVFCTAATFNLSNGLQIVWVP